jgi:P21-Rho-binding domain
VSLISFFIRQRLNLNFLSLVKLAPPQIQTPYQPQSIFNNSKSKKGVGTKKLTKADIGTPSNFKHVTHVGWNAKSGFDLSGEDEALRPFLAKAGISEDQLKDRQTRDFIYDFIQSNNVEEMVRKETRTKPAAPPVPTRNQVCENFHSISSLSKQNPIISESKWRKRQASASSRATASATTKRLFRTAKTTKGATACTSVADFHSAGEKHTYTATPDASTKHKCSTSPATSSNDGNYNDWVVNNRLLIATDAYHFSLHLRRCP